MGKFKGSQSLQRTLTPSCPIRWTWDFRGVKLLKRCQLESGNKCGESLNVLPNYRSDGGSRADGLER